MDQVVGTVELDHLRVRDHRRHQPVAPRCVPRDLRVAERLRFRIERQYRIVRVRLPACAVVEAVRDRLRLGARRVPRTFLVDARVHRDQRRVARRAEAGSVVRVRDDRAGEDFLGRVRAHGDRLLVPVDEVGAGRMAPRHVAPVGAQRVVLIEQVIAAVLVDEAVGVVHPVALRRVMECGPPLRRAVGGRCGAGGARRLYAGRAGEQESGEPEEKAGESRCHARGRASSCGAGEKRARCRRRLHARDGERKARRTRDTRDVRLRSRRRVPPEPVTAACRGRRRCGRRPSPADSTESRRIRRGRRGRSCGRPPSTCR